VTETAPVVHVAPDAAVAEPGTLTAPLLTVAVAVYPVGSVIVGAVRYPVPPLTRVSAMALPEQAPVTTAVTAVLPSVKVGTQVYPEPGLVMVMVLIAPDETVAVAVAVMPTDGLENVIVGTSAYPVPPALGVTVRVPVEETTCSFGTAREAAACTSCEMVSGLPTDTVVPPVVQAVPWVVIVMELTAPLAIAAVAA